MDSEAISINTRYTATLRAVMEDDYKDITFVVMDARNRAHVAIISKDAAIELARWLQQRLTEMQDALQQVGTETDGSGVRC